MAQVQQSRPTHQEKLTAREKAKIIELYVKYGVDKTSLAERFSCGTHTIDAALRQAGVKQSQAQRRGIGWRGSFLS